MKLYYYCSSCKKENSFTTKTSNRFELKEERGLELSERCPRCGMITKRHLNRVHAKPNKLIILLGAVFGVFVAGVLILLILKISFSPILLFLFYLFIPGTFSIPFISWKIADKKASSFNKLLIAD